MRGAANGASAVEACVIRAGCSIRLSTPPSDSASWNSLRPRGERDRLCLGLDQEGDHAAEVAHLAAGDRVAGMAGEARVEDALDGRVLAEEAGDRARVLAVLAHPQRERLDAAQDEPGVEGAGDGAERLLQEAQPRRRARRRSSRRSRRSRRSGRRGTSSSSGRRGRRRARAAAAGRARRRCCRRRGARRRRARPRRRGGCRRRSGAGSTASRPRRAARPRRGSEARFSSNSSAGT